MTATTLLRYIQHPMPSHPQGLGAQIATSTEHCYRQLARAIVAPVFPQDDPAAVTPRRGHLRLLAPEPTRLPIGVRRAA